MSKINKKTWTIKALPVHEIFISLTNISFLACSCMDLFGINGYCLEKRAKLVLEQGVFVSSRSTGKYSLCLYHMGSFFAEVWYQGHTNKIMLVRGFKDEAYLDPYLTSIDVSELMH